MKQLVFILSVFMLCSCGVPVVYLGNITTFSHTGDTLNVYKNVEIQDITVPTKNVFKTFGLNFYDNDSDKFIIISNSTPYTVEYVAKNPYELTEYGDDPKKIKELYYTYQNDVAAYKKKLKTTEGDTPEYYELKSKIKELNKRINTLSDIYYQLTYDTLY